jgi:glycosyltransferase involved in cell wall biosynthesis
MRIAMVASWFSAETGYAENCLSKALASLGHDVHLVTSTAQPYFNSPFYSEVYEPWLGPPVLEEGETEVDGYRVHRLPLASGRGGVGVKIKGLVGGLRRLRPEIVQAFEVVGSTPYAAAVGRPLLRYRLFTGNHVHASVFDEDQRPSMQGRFVGRMTERCYAISPDAAEIAVRSFGIPEGKVVVSPLGVDTDLFRPVGDPESSEARRALRAELGFEDDEVVCIYTGRFTEGPHGKNPRCLAEAVARLSDQGHRFRALFVGGGDPGYTDELRSSPGSVVLPFVGFKDLPRHYWAADVAVWPRQESTSQIDAAACGLPLVLSDRIQVKERVDGNGLLYREDDAEDLARQLLTLEDPAKRREMGAAGAERIGREYGWKVLAQQRISDYEASLGAR